MDSIDNLPTVLDAEVDIETYSPETSNLMTDNITQTSTTERYSATQTPKNTPITSANQTSNPINHTTTPQIIHTLQQNSNLNLRRVFEDFTYIFL